MRSNQALAVFGALWLFVVGVAPVLGDGLEQRLRSLISVAPRVDAGVSVVDLRSGTQIFSHQAEKALKPASILKVLTTSFALEQLGPEYQFETDFYCRSLASGGKCSELIVKGSGDPSLTIESLWNISRTLYARGLRTIGALVLDPSRFVETKQREGQSAYQTGSSALSFNHNSVAFHVCPGKTGENASVTAEPREAKITISGAIRTISKGRGVFSIDERGTGHGLSFALSGTIGVRRSCEVFYRSVENPLGYFAEALRGALSEAGIAQAGSWRVEKVTQDLPLVYRHKSPGLHEIAHDINRFSNNFMAEQMLYRMGSIADGRLSREAGLLLMRNKLLKLGFRDTEFQLADGSGLSHENRLSARIITRVLIEAWRAPAYGVEFASSLSRSGFSGTLKKRDFGLPGMILRGKTGTLDGTSSLGGYLYSATGRPLAFAVLVNRALKSEAEKLEDNLVRAIYNFG